MDDPMKIAARAAQMPGLDFLRDLMERGERAPIQETLGFELVEVDEGRVVFEAEPGPQHYNPIGTVMAALPFALVDASTGAAVHSTLPQGTAYTTLETKINLVRPITADTGRIRGEGTVVHRGRTTATSESRVTGPDGKLLAHGTSTCLIFEIPA